MKQNEIRIRKLAQHKQYLKRKALGIQRKSTFSGTQCLSQKWRLSKEYKLWKLQVLEIHNHTCTECGTHDNLQAHHVKQASKHPELRYDVNNGKCVCFSCHKLIKD